MMRSTVDLRFRMLGFTVMVASTSSPRGALAEQTDYPSDMAEVALAQNTAQPRRTGILTWRYARRTSADDDRLQRLLKLDSGLVTVVLDKLSGIITRKS